MKLETPSDWDQPVFLMNFPLSVSNQVPNNVLMRPDIQGPYDKATACKQWLSLYSYMANEALVYVLPGHGDFQDLPFVANIGCYLPHIENTVLLANFTSPPRRGEEHYASRFFQAFEYKVDRVPHYWEGEADLKWVRDNLYVGGVGIRSSASAFNWMRKMLDMEVVEIGMQDAKLYHLDCVYLPLTEDKALVNTAAISKHDLIKLERITEIIPVPTDYAQQGWTNCVRLGRKLLHAPEKMSVKPFEDLLAKHGFELVLFDLSEFSKSGADLSCLVMHLNWNNRF